MPINKLIIIILASFILTGCSPKPIAVIKYMELISLASTSEIEGSGSGSLFGAYVRIEEASYYVFYVRELQNPHVIPANSAIYNPIMLVKIKCLQTKEDCLNCSSISAINIYEENLAKQFNN